MAQHSKSNSKSKGGAKPKGAVKFDVIIPPNVLKVKVGGNGAAFDEDAVARAEAGLKALAANFAAWLEHDVLRLEEAFEVFSRAASNAKEPVKSPLHRASHDLKGQAGTMGLPLLGRVAGSLADLLTDARPAPVDLIARHVKLIGVLCRGGVAVETESLAEAEALVAASTQCAAKS